MPSAADIAEKAAEYAASTAAGAAGAPARIITTILKFADSSHEKSVRDKARQLLNCPHIVYARTELLIRGR